MKNDGTASDNWLTPDATQSRDEPVAGEPLVLESIPSHALLERVIERSNLQRALKQVRQNKGAPGIDGMTVDLMNRLKRHVDDTALQQCDRGAQYLCDPAGHESGIGNIRPMAPRENRKRARENSAVRRWPEDKVLCGPEKNPPTLGVNPHVP